MRNQVISDDAIQAEIDEWLRIGKPGTLVAKVDPARLLHRIDLNGAGPMLALRSDLHSLPEYLASALRQRLIARTLWEEQHKRILSKALDCLSNAGLLPILIKGTALAYSHYPAPAARVRGDSDVIVEQEGRALAFDAMADAGFDLTLSSGGEIHVAEALFQKTDQAGLVHDIDLHWRLNSSAVLSALFSHEELLSRAVPLPQFSTNAIRMCDSDALLFACVHRSLHVDGPTKIHLDGVAYPVVDSLTWLLDIDLLFRNLSVRDRKDLAARAWVKGVAGILAQALKTSRDRLGTPVQAAELAELEHQGSGAVKRYLDSSPIRKLALNMGATRGLRGRLAFVREMLFPPPHYMRATFSTGRADWLPVLYLRRAWRGLAKQVRRRGHPT